MYTRDQFPYTTHGYYSSLYRTPQRTWLIAHRMNSFHILQAWIFNTGVMSQFHTEPVQWHNDMDRVQQVLKFPDVYY